MRRLIVNADDFGLTPGINRAVIELNAAGVLTSTTLMAGAPAAEEAIHLARTTPTLGVGCHVVLVDGEPVLPAAQIPTLVDKRTGRFFNSLSVFLARLHTGRVRQSEIEAEAAAQIARLQDHGVQLTHIDAHKHTHMFPAVLRPLLRAARAAGIGTIRNPFEPVWAVRATAGAQWARWAEVNVLRRLEATCRRIISEAGFVTTSGTIAVLGTGILNAAMVRSLLAPLPEGTWELVTHPGYCDADLQRIRTRLQGSRDIEREALLTIREFPQVELVSFAALREGNRAEMRI